NAALDVNEKALDKETQLGIQDLEDEELPRLDTGLINVTTGTTIDTDTKKGRNKGYRMLPHGMKFRNNIKVHLGFDKNLIPDGYTEDSIQTYYFDDQAGYWKELERVEIDLENAEIISNTDHFTDMINAVATTPDHPETKSYNETTFKDMKAADPSAGMTLIQPSAANNMGDVRLSYPLELPAGRAGMQPQLASSYNSGGGNGWLGLGWSLGIPEIGIDTRWGVPRYDSGLETETYILNGEQLAPVVHRTELVPRQANKVFHPRIESAFMQIVRHGSNPKNFWWEVKDKNGMTYIYGRTSQARLMDDSGNTFKWALEQTLDTHGNTVNYHYVTVQDTGLSGGSVTGRDLYIQSIDYTGYEETKGLYEVRFLRDRDLGEGQRNDVTISGRGGFKQVTADLLRKVEVYFQDQLSRSYAFNYRTGAFGKSLLDSIMQKGNEGGDFYAHTFDYYNDVAGGLFGSSQGWDTRNDGISGGFFGVGDASAISGNKSDSIGGHLYIGINLLMPTKQMSIGGKGGYSRTKSEGMLAQIDINGDGLPDKVYRDGGGIYYRPNQSGPDGGTRFGSEYKVGNLSRISKGRSSMYSGGAELYMGASVGFNIAGTFSKTSVFFTEVNGDGLPDIVDNGRVLFNHIDADGHPYFSSNAGDTPYPIGQSAVNTADLLQNSEVLKQEFAKNNPLLDTVRRWTAPYDGQIEISGDATLVAPTAVEGSEDGVKVSIQHNETSLWTTEIAANDHVTKEPSLSALTVKKGDAIYFRVQSQFDATNDNVQWNPEITYLNCELPAETTDPLITSTTPQLDANGLNQCRFNATDDFVLSGYHIMHINMPVDGQIQITGVLEKTAITTDDVSLQIVQNNEIVYEQLLTWQQIDTIDLAEKIDVIKQDKLELRVKIDSPIDLSKLKWSQAPKLTYLSSPDIPNVQDPDGNYVITMDLVYGFDVYAEHSLTEPLATWVAASAGQYTVSPLLALNPLTESDQDTTEKIIYMTVKRQGELVIKHEMSVINQAIQNQSFSFAANAGDKLFFEFSSRDFNVEDFSQVAAGISGGGVNESLPTALYATGENLIIAPAYRQWTAFAYDGDGDNQDQPLLITEQDLNGESFKEQAEQLQAQQDKIPDEETFKNANLDELDLPEQPRLKIVPFYPKPAENRWQASYEGVWVAANNMSSGRQGLSSFDVPSPSSFTGRRGIIKHSNSKQMSVMLGAGFLSGSLSRTKTQGFGEMMDFNGDRFVDILSGCIQYTNMLGTLEGGCHNRMGRVRATEGYGANFGIGGNYPLLKGKGSGNAGTSNNQMASLGISGNLTFGENETLHDIMDVNGDGLPDLVFEGLKVALNLGYRFASPEPWGGADINTTESMGFALGASGGASFNDGIYGFGGGISLSKSEAKSIKVLLDINGDGILDSIQDRSAKYNTGNGFKGGSDSTNEDVTNADITLGGGVYFTIGIPIGIPPAGFFLIINPGFDINRTVNRQEIAFVDVDGDGNPDLVESQKDGSMTVRPSNVRRTNMLKTVHNPLGGSMTVDYERLGNTYAQPQSRWVMSRLEIHDGHAGDGVDTQVKTFQYEDGFYHRQERDFYGFAKVIEQHLDENGTVYRATTRLFHNDSYYNKGLMYKETTIDAQGNKWLETESRYTLLNLDTNATLANLNHLTARVFPQLTRTDKRFYEGQATVSKSTYTMQRYDEYGNVVWLFDAADIGAQDDIEADITYFKDVANYIVGKASGIVVKGAGTTMRRRAATFENGTGDLLQIQEFLANGQTATTEMRYDQYGNIKTVISPQNYRGQQYRLDYQYDGQVFTHNTQVKDSFGYISKANYDLVFGQVQQTIDINQQPIDYEYDEFGRVIQLIGPYQTGSGLYTLEFEYHQNAQPAWALTRHIDVYRNKADPIETVVFVDGLKRPIQTKKDLTIHQGDNARARDVMQVSGLVVYDFLGRAIEQYYPITENLGNQGKFNPQRDNIVPTRTTYDVMDRALTMTIPDQTTTTTQYGFGIDRDAKTQFLTRVIDANGIAKESYKDIRGVITAVKEFNDGGAQTIWTSYAYDPLKQIIEVKDDQNNLTEVGYDNFGRRVFIDNPDTGLV
ncbi:MAG: SpvB/TcaC N-terminal domain-containing protein, partial [Thiotrichaceae bacterium]|nr:SpvB/TcaC N-terminal domain-containing protein [Thiotrichaceae bacterium]